jgi:hypothetical protein
MVYKQLAFQRDGYNCGVFMIGYFHCLLFGMNPRRLTAPLMTEYRQRIFAAMHGAKVKVYPPSPWQEPNPEKRKQAFLPALTPAISRSIAKKRREGTSSTGSHLLNFDQLKENATALRNEWAAQEQERRDGRALKVEADKVRQKASDVIAKIREQNIKKANAKVNILLRGGLDENMKKKKGKMRDRHIRNFLDENLGAPTSVDGAADPPEGLDGLEVDADTASQEQIAKLKFERTHQ